MIILSDCLGEKTDEGALKVANSLTGRMKAGYPDTTVISYGKRSGNADVHMNLNRLFLNPSFCRFIREKREPLLYIPFASNTRASALRLCILSLFVKSRLNVLFSLRHPMDHVTKWLLRMSGAEIIVLSQDSKDYFEAEIGKRCFYLRAGVDLEKFTPVDEQQRQNLREKYRVMPDEKVLVHVGHLKKERNIDKLLNVEEQYRVFLVVSSATEQDPVLKKQLIAKSNITVIDEYLEHVEEIYQMADIYLFPVQEMENCIDTPLSVLEAAACNVPIVTSMYGELKMFRTESGFLFLDSFGETELNCALAKMAEGRECHNRKAVQQYNWDQAVACLEKWMKRSRKVQRAALIGLDGSGKSANIEQMKSDSDYKGYQFLWVRWKPILLKPAYLLLEKKLQKKRRSASEVRDSEYRQKDGLKGRIFRNPIIRDIWMMLALTDYLVQFYIKTVGALWRKENIIFDRFYLDLFVDQGINFGYTPEQIAGEIRRFQWMFPKINTLVYIRVSPEVCYARKDDIPNMDYLNRRYKIYEYLSQGADWKIVDGEADFLTVNSEIKNVLLNE